MAVDAYISTVMPIGFQTVPNNSPYSAKEVQNDKRRQNLKTTLRQYCRRSFQLAKYCTPQLYFGWEICVTPLHCSYGQIGYTVHFPYTNIPEVEYDWEMGKLTIDGEKWKSYLRNE